MSADRTVEQSMRTIEVSVREWSVAMRRVWKAVAEFAVRLDAVRLDLEGVARYERQVARARRRSQAQRRKPRKHGVPRGR